MSEFIKEWRNNNDYLKMVDLMAQLSNIFSESKTPFLHYRVAENLFCRYYDAINLSRSDISYDAQIGDLGVGIKTFTLSDKAYSVEKVAEFNKLAPTLKLLDGRVLAKEVARLRNARIAMADSLQAINNRLYHIIGRKEGELAIFNTPYQFVDIDNICDVKSDKKNGNISFNDGINEYRFYRSKSVLMQRFDITEDVVYREINIIEDPYTLLEMLLSKYQDAAAISAKEYIVLPLYSERNGGCVPQKSGLNQWNADGRPRDENEVYIPVPKYIYKNFPDFLPERKMSFNLHLPNGDVLSAAICQSGGKALMSNPNSALGKYLLRDVMKIPKGELVTMEKLFELGFDSVVLTKIDDENYKLSVSESLSYRDYAD